MKTHIKQTLVNSATFLTGALYVVGDFGYNLGPLLLFLLSIFLLWSAEIKVNRAVIILIGIMLSYFLVRLILFWVHNEPLNSIDNPSRYVFLIPVLILVISIRPSIQSIKFGIGTGAYFAAIYAAHDKLILGYDRAFEMLEKIQYGNASMTLGMMSLCFALNAKAQNKKLEAFFFLFATVCGLFASLLSGTRGGWILLPVVLFVIYLNYRNFISSRQKKLMLGTFATVILIAFIPQVGVKDRINSALSDLERFNEDNPYRYHSSIGFRVASWEFYWDHFLLKPIAGFGTSNLNEQKDIKVASGEYPAALVHLKSHAHNQYLEEMGSRGIVGLLTLLALLLYPLNFFRKRVNYSQATDASGVATAGVVLCLTMLDYFLTQCYFLHHSGNIMYGGMMVILFGYLASQEELSSS